MAETKSLENKPPLKISELTAVTAVQASTLLAVVLGDVTNKITFGNFTKTLATKTDLNSKANTSDLTPITTALTTIQEEITTLQQVDLEIAPKVEQLIIDVNKLKQDVTKLQTDYVTLEGRVTALETPETP